jgi:peptide/nickel transport system ATP-binding protein
VMMCSATPNSIVIAGLDPAIHQSSQESFSKEMDPRVKPGGDDSFVEVCR